MSCTHHWVLPSPEGRFVTGRCKHCGTRRRFHNAFEEQAVFNKRTPPRLKGLE